MKGEIMPSSGFIDVSNGHCVHYEVHGPEDGIPVIFLHGGPGSGFSPDYLKFFLNKKIKLIAFDQRGSGKSTPLGINQYNTTQDLIDDIEILRCHLKIKKWYVSGHSWGTTLGLLYGIRNFSKCHGFLFSSLFLGREKDQEWSFDGARAFLPDIFKTIEENIPRPINCGFYKRLTEGTEKEKKDAAYYFALLGAYLCRVSPVAPTYEGIDRSAINKAALLLHYAKNKFYMPEDYILQNVSVLKEIPMWLLHGRLDLDCQVQQAIDLKAVLPDLKLVICQGSHSLFEDVMAESFQKMVDEMIAYEINDRSKN